MTSEKHRESEFHYVLHIKDPKMRGKKIVFLGNISDRVFVNIFCKEAFQYLKEKSTYHKNQFRWIKLRRFLLASDVVIKKECLSNS